jgi:hypothetical protein
LSLCKILQQDPDRFFLDDSKAVIVTPAHRKRRNAKVKPEMQDESFELAQEYELLFKQAPRSDLLMVTRERDRSEVNALRIAGQMRRIAGVEPEKPIDYRHTFQLLERLGINVIFRNFPASIKSYAFYTAIHGHRVVFVNNSTNVIDLIFPLLHETVHAIRDEIAPPGSDYDEAEEDFCDLVAGYIQFPAEYVNLVYNTISGLPAGVQVNKLKNFGKQFSHSLYGLVKQIQRSQPDFTLDPAGADANLRKELPAIGEILFEGDDVRQYLRKVSLLNSNFTRLLAEQADSLSDRKLCELLGLDGVLDRQTIRDQLVTFSTPSFT